MTAFLRDLLRYCGLIHNLVLRDLKLKYRGSVLGIIWSLLNPLLTLAVYSFAFHTVLRVQMENYAFFLSILVSPAVALLVGLAVFRRMSPSFAERV